MENEYLFRPKEKGELEIAVLGIKLNDTNGGDKGKPSKIEDIFNVTKTGPTENSIKITFYLHSLFLYSILDRINKEEDCDHEIDTEDIVLLIFKPYSSFLLSASMLDNVTK